LINPPVIMQLWGSCASPQVTAPNLAADHADVVITISA
jgi:hypothetical protein